MLGPRLFRSKKFVGKLAEGLVSANIRVGVELVGYSGWGSFQGGFTPITPTLLLLKHNVQ